MTHGTHCQSCLCSDLLQAALPWRQSVKWCTARSTARLFSSIWQIGESSNNFPPSLEWSCNSWAKAWQVVVLWSVTRDHSHCPSTEARMTWNKQRPCSRAANDFCHNIFPSVFHVWKGKRSLQLGLLQFWGQRRCTLLSSYLQAHQLQPTHPNREMHPEHWFASIIHSSYIF